MKFIVSTSVLLKELLVIDGVIMGNPTLPILENFLFEIKEGNLTLRATDLETTMTATLSVESKEDMCIAIPSKKLIETLRTLPEQPITFTINDELLSIEINSEIGKYKLIGENGMEFPSVPVLENASTLDINSIILEKAISKTVFAVGNDPNKMALTGVYFKLNTDNLNMVSTDAHRLVSYLRNDSKTENETAFILPKKALTLLKTALSGTDENVRIIYNRQNAYFSFGNINLICRLIDENYPDFAAIVPKNNKFELIVNRLELLNSLKRISIYSNEATKQVKFEITGSQLKLFGEDLDFSSEANEKIDCQYNGKDMEISFNAKLLIEMLSHLESREIVLKLSQSNKAGILRQVDENENVKEDIFMLVMPVTSGR